jgi:hypothetical protein
MNDQTSLSNDFQEIAKPVADKLSRKAAPFSLRLSAKERERLRREAGDKPLGRYIRMRLLDKNKPEPGELAEALALLGKSQIARHLALLAEEARSGALLLDEQTLKQIDLACRHTEEIRALLIKALGLLER